MRERQKEQESPRQMDGGSGKMGWEKRKETGGGSEKKREREKGDTFITRRSATGKIERQVVFAGGSLPGPRGEHEEGTEGCAGCTNETRGKEGTAYGSQGTRIAVLLRDHFLCKIKYCKYDGSGHTYTHAFTHIYTRTDEKLEGERGVFVFVDEGRMPLREVGPLRSRSSKEHTRRR